MSRLSTIVILTAAATFALATASFSGAVPNNGGGSSQGNDAATIAQLQVAAKQALADMEETETKTMPNSCGRTTKSIF